MTRPTVLIATTQPAMSYALGEKLKPICQKRGLKLEVCPDGVESVVGDANVRAYDSAEALFEALEKRNPMELADTLVVLDIGTQLTGAFEPKAPKDECWHITDNRAGVAVELLLRFPQVFPVFLSPSVPVEDQIENTDKVVLPARIEVHEGKWEAFHSLQDSLCRKDEFPYFRFAVHAFCVPLHFVSPLDGGLGLSSTISRFARGMRCWFDPTGLRTLVKCRFLGTLFGSATVWDNTLDQREVLLDRLDHAAVAIDEEREFAMLNAYAAYKFGRRSWIVTTFGEFNDEPLWVAKMPDVAHNLDVVVLRDIDLRFPDVEPDSAAPGGGKSLRDQLKSVINSDIWNMVNNQSRIGKNWRLRVVSSQADIVAEKEADWDIEQKRIGENDDKSKNGKYIGLTKPIGSLYELKELLFKVGEQANSVASRLDIVKDDDKKTGGHGAPYLNLAMAESLLLQSKDYKVGPVENLVGALLAGEAYELLLCMSKTTALEALLLQHKKEVAAEVEFPGVAHAINIRSRCEDIEATLNKINEKEPTASSRNMFLSQFWSELRTVYKNGEQFQAAEQANVESLVHSTWRPKRPRWPWLEKLILTLPRLHWPEKFLPGSVLERNQHVIGVKSFFIKPAISFWMWLTWAILGSAVFTSFYILSTQCGENIRWERVIPVLHQVILSSLSASPAKGIIEIEDCLDLKVTDTATQVVAPDVGFYLLTLVHFAFSYVMLGLLISMIFRKITRA